MNTAINEYRGVGCRIEKKKRCFCSAKGSWCVRVRGERKKKKKFIHATQMAPLNHGTVAVEAFSIVIPMYGPASDRELEAVAGRMTL